MPPRKPRLTPEERTMRAAARMIPGTLAGRAESASPVKLQNAAPQAVPSSGSHTHDGAGTRSTITGGVAEADPGVPVASALQSVAYGDFAQATGAGAVAIGAGPSTTTSARAASGSVAIGGSSNTGSEFGARADGTVAVAIGMRAQASADDAIAIGYIALASAVWALAVGDEATATAERASAFGHDADALHQLSVALGAESVTSAASQVHIADRHIEMIELPADPAAPAASTARLYAKDNGSGKTQLVVRFPTGAVQVLATEP